MDLRGFYQRIREMESSIRSEHVVVMSLETPDGGKAGVCTEVGRLPAARLIVEQRARIATEEEIAVFRGRQHEAAQQLEQTRLAGRMQIAILPETEVRQLRERIGPKKA